MEWAWIDDEKKYLVLPGAVTKNKREHLVPLVPQAMKLLETMKPLAGDSPYVFPGPTGKAINWVQRACDRVMENAKIEDGRHHDTRRVIQTITTNTPSTTAKAPPTVPSDPSSATGLGLAS